MADYPPLRSREVLVPQFSEMVVRRYRRDRPETVIEAMVTASPFEHVEESTEELAERLEPLRRALDPDGGILDDRERWVIESIFFRRISFRDLAKEIPWSTTHLHRVKDSALRKLRDHLTDVYTTTQETD